MSDEDTNQPNPSHYGCKRSHGFKSMLDALTGSFFFFFCNYVDPKWECVLERTYSLLRTVFRAAHKSVPIRIQRPCLVNLVGLLKLETTGCCFGKPLSAIVLPIVLFEKFSYSLWVGILWQVLWGEPPLYVCMCVCKTAKP